MSFVVIRLHPKDPVGSGAAFSPYLDDLEISIRDLSFEDPRGIELSSKLGAAKWTNNLTTTRIVQHLIVFPPGPAPVATAVVELTAPLGDEYLTPDLVLDVKRVTGGVTRTIHSQYVHFNVPVVAGAVPGVPPLPATLAGVYEGLGPVAAYVPLPKPASGLSPGVAWLDVAADGTPPPFIELRTEVAKVLAQDPNPAPDLATLTAPQCLHIAREIVTNRQLEPLPVPGNLSAYYLGQDETGRRRFEAELITYYTSASTRADVLARYIFAMSAGLACEARAVAQTSVGLSLPILPGITPPTGQPPHTTVAVTQ